MLPDELLLHLTSEIPCREFQLRALASLLGDEDASTPALVVHGLEATGKSLVTRKVLRALKIPHAIIDSRECITGRQLLEQTIAAAAEAVQEHYGDAPVIKEGLRCENLTALQVQLGRLLPDGRRLVLVFDGIDRQREPPPTLIPALARLGEAVGNLTTVFILSVPSPRYFHTTGIPHLHFPPYNRDELCRILALEPPKIFPNGLDPDVDYTEEQAAEDDVYLWRRFCGAVWDTLGKGAARDLSSFRTVCTKLWKPFTAPIVDGTFGTRDFARLMVHRRTLFQDENILLHNIISSQAPSSTTPTTARKQATHELPYYAKYLLCAAYLASFNPAKQDPIFFTKHHERQRKRRKSNLASAKDRRARRIPRSMLAPAPFPLDRMLAILHAIVPHAVPQSADVLAQIATLCSLRLLLRAGGVYGADALDGAARWRVNCGWEYVLNLARSVDFEIADFVAGTAE